VQVAVPELGHGFFPPTSLSALVMVDLVPSFKLKSSDPIWSGLASSKKELYKNSIDTIILENLYSSFRSSLKRMLSKYV
jgi:hypothetical protein